MPTKVCILTTVHPPFDTRIFHKQAKTLVEAGYDVTLIAQHDRDEVVDGVKIIALPKLKNRFARILGLTWYAFWLALKQKADVYHFHDPELLPIGVLLKLFARAKVIYDVHEDYPKQILFKRWINPLFRKVVAASWGRLELKESKMLDAIVVVSEIIASRFPPYKTVVIKNYPDLRLFLHESLDYRERPAHVVYVGGLTKMRGVYQMVQAIGQLPERLEAKLLLAGRFEPSSLQDSLSNVSGWERTEYLGYLNRAEVVRLLTTARVGLVPLLPEPKHFSGVPVKLFEYMAAGVPVVCADYPHWRDIITQAKCGLMVNPLDPQEMSEAIQWILVHPDEAAEMSLSGRRAVQKYYSWSTEGRKLLKLYAKLGE